MRADGRDMAEDKAGARQDSVYLAMRCLSACVDALIVGVVATAAYCALADVRQVYVNFEADPLNPAVYWSIVVHVTLLHGLAWALYMIYAAIMEASALQATAGKKLCRLKVSDGEGRRIGLGKSVARNLAKTVSHLALDLGFVWIFVSPARLAWHDRWTGTMVRSARGPAAKTIQE